MAAARHDRRDQPPHGSGSIPPALDPRFGHAAEFARDVATAATPRSAAVDDLGVNRLPANTAEPVS
ncbi:hypothetical protein GCM10011490_04770 [Pseudoclavibacter endophyticus]|nr:hypothetical protein GCM10011490_04770 [Pseudoclavibacter endophyticus]